VRNKAPQKSLLESFNFGLNYYYFMESRSWAALIIVLTLAGLTGGYFLFGQSYIGIISGENPNSTDVSDGRLEFKQDNKSAKVNNGENNISNDTNDESEDLREGIVLFGELKKGEVSRLGVYNEGNPVSNQKVYVNGKEIGKTSELGYLKFEVPETGEINITTENEIGNRVEQISNSEEVNIEIFGPADGETVEGPEVELRYRIESESKSNYTVVSNGVERASGTFRGEHGESLETYFAESGRNEWTVKIEMGKDEKTLTESFELEEAISPIQVQINKVDTEENLVYYEIESPVLYNYKIYRNGKEVVNQNVPAGDHLSPEQLKVQTGDEIRLEATPLETNQRFTSDTYEVQK
jgi:hypothetical protein